MVPRRPPPAVLTAVEGDLLVAFVRVEGRTFRLKNRTDPEMAEACGRLLDAFGPMEIVSLT